MVGSDEHGMQSDGDHSMLIWINVALHMMMVLGFLLTHEGNRAERGWRAAGGRKGIPATLAEQSFRAWFAAKKAEQLERLCAGFQKACRNDSRITQIIYLEARLAHAPGKGELDDEDKRVFTLVKDTLPEAQNNAENTVRRFVIEACKNANVNATSDASTFVTQGLEETGSHALALDKLTEREDMEESPFDVDQHWSNYALPENVRELARRVRAELAGTRKRLAECQLQLVARRMFVDIASDSSEKKGIALLNSWIDKWCKDLALLPEVEDYLQNSKGGTNVTTDTKEVLP